MELLNVRLLPAEAVLAGRATTTGEEVAVLRGDLSVEPLPVVLVQLAAGAATGCLHLQDLAGAPAAVYLRSGCVYSVSAPGRQPQLSTRLLTSGATGSAELVEAFVAEQVLASVSGLLTWTAGSWRFRVNERTHDDVARPVPVVGLLAEVGRRGAVWAGLAPVVHGAAAVVALSAAGGSADELAIDADAWSLLCRVDGARTLGELAHDCGLTLYEAGQIAHALVVAGLVTIAAPSRPGQVDEDAAVVGAPDALAAAVRLALSLAAPPPLSDRSGPMPVQDQDQDPCLDDGTNGGTGDLHDVDSSISRVSQAPSALLGPTPPRNVFGGLEAGQARLSDEAEQAAARLEAARSQQAAASAELAAFARAEVGGTPGAVPTGVARSLVTAPFVGQAFGQGPEAFEPEGVDTDTDTAALLRELSSLGLDDDPAPEESAPTRRRPTATTAAQKKRKGLFGRT